MANSSSLTIKQAASSLGVSTRTIRRRIAEGELSATKQRRGKQDVTLLDGSEVARWAQASGLAMTAEGNPSDTPQADIVAGPEQALTETADLARLQATCDGQAETIKAQTVTIEALQGQVTFLQEQVRLLTTRALPPAPAERRTWWQRLTGGGNGADKS
jgi:excisionase family DNA binding protein